MNKQVETFTKNSDQLRNIPGINPERKKMLQSPRRFMRPSFIYDEERLESMQKDEERILAHRKKRKEEYESLFGKKHEEAVSVTS